jgi:diacylglycerol kinase (ATP)
LDDGALKIGLLVNPGSGRGTGKGLALAEKLKATPVEILQQFADLKPALQNLSNQGVDTLAISSGDGTVQAIQTLLAETTIFKTAPTLCLLSHGTTNLTAHDIGLRIQTVDAQATFLQSAMARESVTRSTLRIVNPHDGMPRHGMFFGTGVIGPAVRYAQRELNDKGIHGAKAGVLTFVKVAGDYLLNRNSPDRIDQPHDMIVKSEGGEIASGPQLFCIGTTLHCLMAGAYPFWGQEIGEIRMTVVSHPPPHLLRWGLPIARGWASAAGSGATSCNSGQISIQTSAAFMLDGEFFSGPQDAALHIETGTRFTYLTR